MSVSQLLSLEKDELSEAAKSMEPLEISALVSLLPEKNDKIRYNAFLLLQHRSEMQNDVYPYFDIFAEKLKSDNSYQRSIGAMLIACNAKWDSLNKLNAVIGDYLLLLKDEKPITVRQCIQSLANIVPYKPELNDIIADCLFSIELADIKETMRKLVLMDTLSILAIIKKNKTSDKIEKYFSDALLGGILDKKAKKQVELLMW